MIGSYKAKEESRLALMRDERSRIKNRFRDFIGSITAPELLGVVQMLQALLATVEARRDAAIVHLGKAADQRSVRHQHFRNRQAFHAEYRPVHQPDIFLTALFSVLAILIEGGITAAMLVSDGKVDIPAGVAYGIIFAFVNVMLGLVLGFFTLRYWNYGKGVQNPDAEILLYRRAAKIGFFIGIVALALLIFAAARLRAVGSHHNVFTFTETGLVETFNDGVTLIIVVIGVLSAVISCWKGRSGFSDPCPGLSEAWSQATEEVDDLAEEIAEEAIDAIEDLCAGGLEQAQDALDEAEAEPERLKGEFSQVADAINGHNDRIDAEIGNLKVSAAGGARLSRYVLQDRAPEPPVVDEASFNDLRITSIDDRWSSLDPRNSDEADQVASLLTRIDAVRDAAVADIRAALAAYHADAPTLELIFEEGGK